MNIPREEKAMGQNFFVYFALEHSLSLGHGHVPHHSLPYHHCNFRVLSFMILHTSLNLLLGLGRFSAQHTVYLSLNTLVDAEARNPPYIYYIHLLHQQFCSSRSSRTKWMRRHHQRQCKVKKSLLAIRENQTRLITHFFQTLVCYQIHFYCIYLYF